MFTLRLPISNTNHRWARSQPSAAAVTALGALAVHTSLESVTAEDLADVDVVVHAAAYVEEWGSLPRFEAINVVGTQRLLDAAQGCGSAALHPDLDETYVPTGRLPFAYATTKAAALMSTAMTVRTDRARQELSWQPVATRQGALESLSVGR